MAVTTTNRFGLKRWSADADPFEREDLDANMAAIEAQAARFSAGTLASRPAPGKAGTFYRVTDADPTSSLPTVYFDTGAAWIELRPNLTAYAKAQALADGLADRVTQAQLTAGLNTRLAGDSEQTFDVVTKVVTSALGEASGLGGAAQRWDTGLGNPTNGSGATVADGDRILVMLQGASTDPGEPGVNNGVYVARAGAWEFYGNGRPVRALGGPTFVPRRERITRIDSSTYVFTDFARVVSTLEGNVSGGYPILGVVAPGANPKLPSTLNGFVGQITYWGGPNVPPGWALAAGAIISTTAYPELFAEYGHRHSGGTPPGAGVFKLPTVPDPVNGLVRAIVCLGRTS